MPWSIAHEGLSAPENLVGVSEDSREHLAEAWSLTRALAKRRYVNRMAPEADGAIRANNYPLNHPTFSHFAPATPWTIDLTDDVHHLFWFAVFDLDAKTPDAHAQADEDLGVLVRILRTVGLPYVVCRSSPTGGYHVWLPLTGVAKPVMVQLAAAARNALPSLDHGLLCNDRTGAVRPPGSPHVRGGVSQVMQDDEFGDVDVNLLCHPTVSASDLLRVTAALRELRPSVDPADEKPTGPVDAAHRVHRELPQWGQSHMATVAGGRDPSRTGYLCLLAAAVSGWTLADVQRAVRTAPGMEHYRTRNNPTGQHRTPRKASEAEARLKRQWAKAQDRAVSYRYAPREGAERDLTELAGILNVVDGMLTSFRVSPGRWARAESDFHDSNILTALAWLSLRSGQRNVGAALRTLAGLTGIPSSTVDRSLRRLLEGGWVERPRAAEGLEAAVWRVSDKFSTRDEQDGPLQDVTARPPEELFDTRIALLTELEDRIEAGRHDVFTRAGLGPTARRVYESLTLTELRDEEVAVRAGLPRGRARAALARLRHHRLVVTSPSGWRRRRHDQRNAAAKRLGVAQAQALARRAQQYIWERSQWAWWNAEVVFRAGRTAKQRRRPDTGQVRFRTYDERGNEDSWPAYPRDSEGRADHRRAMRFVRSGVLQDLRDLELAA